ncbi:trypsin-7-like [Culicoides brevitarsis]|uniref:trypsin-7-like n=1 Tax=Culicoides brevitarsis TaxID=469753 RepID=UPI00307B161C
MKFTLLILFVISDSQQAKLKSKNSLRPFIIGGEPITIDQAPYQVSLLFRGFHKCGASIISQKWILTACHCVDDFNTLSDLKVRAGSRYHRYGGKLFKIRNIFSNPKCNIENATFDSALIELRHKIRFGKKIQAINLPMENEELAAGTLVNISGWGATRFPGFNSDVLMSTEVAIVDYEKCKKVYSFDYFGPDVICAQVEGGGKDTCTGDSGGPLTHNGTLFGITSWGRGCGTARYPGVYSNVAYIREWIRKVAGV